MSYEPCAFRDAKQEEDRTPLALKAYLCSLKSAPSQLEAGPEDTTDGERKAGIRWFQMLTVVASKVAAIVEAIAAACAASAGGRARVVEAITSKVELCEPAATG